MEKQKNTKSIKRLVVASLILIIFSFSLFLLFYSQGESITANFFLILTAFFGIISLITLFFFIGEYNTLVRKKNKISESFALMDVYLKMRFDLVPNLVRSVKGYMEHEQSVLKEITLLRKQANKANGEEEMISLSNQLAGHMAEIFISVENYPELKADKVFLNLMEQLRDVENKIAASRRFYNTSVRGYNNSVQSFPSNVIAKSYGFALEKSFEIEVNERVLPKFSLTE
jgi:LemA protein